MRLIYWSMSWLQNYPVPVLMDLTFLIWIKELQVLRDLAWAREPAADKIQFEIKSAHGQKIFDQPQKGETNIRK